EGGSPGITTPGFVCGTPDYMSPEQARGDRVDGRSDLYSLGVVLFELLTGRLPFVDTTPARVALLHIHGAIPDPREVAPDRHIPSFLAEFSTRALAKSPGQRFQNAEEMRAALQELRRKLTDRAVEKPHGPTGVW